MAMVPTTTSIADKLLDTITELFMTEMRRVAETLTILRREDVKALIQKTDGEAVTELLNVSPKAEPVTNGKARKPYVRLSNDDKALIRRMRDKEPGKWTYAKLAQRFDVSPGTVQKLFPTKPSIVRARAH